MYSNIGQQVFVYDVDTASPTTEFPVSRYTRLRMYTGTPLARNNQRGVIIEELAVLVLKSSEVLHVNRDKNNRLDVALQVYAVYKVLEIIFSGPTTGYVRRHQDTPEH